MQLTLYNIFVQLITLFLSLMISSYKQWTATELIYVMIHSIFNIFMRSMKAVGQTAFGGKHE